MKRSKRSEIFAYLAHDGQLARHARTSGRTAALASSGELERQSLRNAPWLLSPRVFGRARRRRATCRGACDDPKSGIEMAPFALLEMHVAERSAAAPCVSAWRRRFER
ncbi:hypothetical protein AKJ09_06178 [Labilithrix luteola]|uniref:Uncharacterized protein n=1 Tax=Labilithrix luteola TaxID=1391654 RepID=A0A0K1Q2A3_9BACT|nr:hypothetical protein AKJ09_06178 [Labilithrix luteola]